MALDTSLYEYQPSFILGFHGCAQTTGASLLRGSESHLKWSEKKYDWLGHGIYFWEGNLARAWEWAHARQAEGKIETPFVLGAIIDLRHCLDLFDLASMRLVQAAHQAAQAAFDRDGEALPVNVGHTPDKAGRALDCVVMNMLHQVRDDRNLPAFDSVRGPFLEGETIYPDAGFRSHSHIQICVRETACIKGYFRPITGG